MFRRLLIACLLLPLAAVAAGTTDPAPRYARANEKPIASYIVLLRLRYDLYGKWRDTGKWPDDPAANEALAGHGKYWQEQLGRGNALLAAGMKDDYWDNVAFVIFEAESLEKAKAIVAADPAVKAYVFQAQVRPLDVHFISDKYPKIKYSKND
ncbi:MAG TPA: YciI family protein [Xanthomonadales bacterium]|nr:YciI family protein [Xanthomonadales bacterium]